VPNNPAQMCLDLEGPIGLRVSWRQMFGDNPPVRQARQRWACWLQIARKAGKRGGNGLLAKMWTSPEGCYDEGEKCRHLRGRAWCRLQELPACYNPILSAQLGMPGMACMGFGKDAKNGTADK